MTIHEGNALHALPTLPRKSARTCITSPPYWGLRDYGDPGQDWPAVEFTIALGGVDVPVSVPAMTAPLGLEPTPIAYVGHLVAIFREVWDVLADDGTLWLNLGDTYASDTGPAWGPSPSSRAARLGRTSRATAGLKPKDLMGIPWLVAYALRSDGWYLRSEIIWHKPNPMPESVTDRPTKGHEQLFLLAKGPRYHCDMGAIEELAMSSGLLGVGAVAMRGTEYGQSVQDGQRKGTRNKRTVWSISSRPFSGAHFAVMPDKLIEPCILAGSEPGDTVLDPFAGAATVGLVAEKHGRSFLGVDLSADYAALGRERMLRGREMLGTVTASDVATVEGPVQLGLLG